MLIASFLPGFIWLLFFLSEDSRPEPKSLIMLVFAIGAIGAICIAFLGIPVKAAFFSQDNPLNNLDSITLPYLTFAAFLEEAGKFAIVYLLVRKWASFDEPVDAMIYMIVGALGFATIENLAYVSREAQINPLLGDVVQIASLRFVGSTLLHALSSGIVGYFWALSIRRFGDKKLILLGIIVATILHTYFNYLIISYVNVAFLIVLLLMAGFFVLNDFEELKWRSI